MEVFIFFGIFILLAISLVLFVYTQFRNGLKKAMIKFNLNEFEKYKINFKQVSYPKNFGSTYGGTRVNAILYYSEDTIIINSEKNLFLAFLRGYLFPIILVKETNNYYHKVPYSIYKKENFPLRIKHFTSSHDNEISIIIKEDKDIEKQIIEKILNWRS